MAIPKKYKTLAEISKRMEKKPILVGGSAVELYTLGGSTSIDLDLIARRRDIRPVLEEMGFKETGKYFKRQDEFIDLVGSDLGDKKTQDVKLSETDEEITVIGVEDLIIDRLKACKFWKSGRDCEQAEFLYKGYKSQLDLGYLKKKANAEGVADKLRTL